jgi:hypothetical protein
MAFTLTLKTENAAFEGDNLEHEIARILRVIADKLENGYRHGTARDLNGNMVAQFRVKGAK